MKKYFLPILIIFLVLVFGLGGYYYLYSQPVDQNLTTKQRFVVPKGQSVTAIANRLEEENLIKSPLVFRLVVKMAGLDSKLQAGSFELAPNMTPAQIATAMTQGTNDIWVTILEGWRREQIADSLTEYELSSFDKADFLALTAGEEGKVFPDTYLFARESTASTVYGAIKNNFDKKVVQGLAAEIDQSSRSFDEILIMASIVEREARGYDEMRQVAGILWNRIEIDMALQTDATLQYVKGFNTQTQSWWEPPSAADKTLNSPFNTYLYTGLPPAPISNPGIEAIKAVLNPAKTSNLYYLHDRSGKIHYGGNLEEHNANVQQYLR